MENKTKICPYCGHEIKATAKKCRYCGRWLPAENAPEISDATHPQVQQVATTKKNNTPWIIASIALILIIVVAGIINISMGRNSKTQPTQAAVEAADSDQWTDDSDTIVDTDPYASDTTVDMSSEDSYGSETDDNTDYSNSYDESGSQY